MTTLQLKKILINQINDIDDVAFLNEIKSIIDSKSNQQIFKLTAEQHKEINASIKDFRNGNLIAQSEIDKEVAKWANEK